MNLSALVLHLTWAVPDIFASCVSNGIHSVSIKYTSLFNTEFFLHPPVSRASEYSISLFEIQGDFVLTGPPLNLLSVGR